MSRQSSADIFRTPSCLHDVARIARRVGAAAMLAAASACASFPGMGGEEAAAAAEEDAAANEVRIASLEAEVARLKGQNARLANDLLAARRELDRVEPGEQEPSTTEGETASAPLSRAEEPAGKPNAVVDDAASPALARTEVPVQPAPRLVQPTFASNEVVFENEAEGEISTQSVLFGVHLASYRHEGEARAGWRKLQRDNPDELGLLEPRIEMVTVDGKGDFLRLVGGGFASRDKAEALCGQLKARQLYCSVTSFSGERLSLAETGQ